MSASQSNELPSDLDNRNSSDWGNAWICKITNESSNRITFFNPYNNNKVGEIPAGKQESNNSKGYIPFSSSEKVYQVTYYNMNLHTWSNVSITDLNRDWMLSFEQAGVVDECPVQPAEGNTPEITLIFNDAGYKFAGCGFGNIVLKSFILRQYPR